MRVSFWHSLFTLFIKDKNIDIFSNLHYNGYELESKIKIEENI